VSTAAPAVDPTPAAPVAIPLSKLGLGAVGHVVTRSGAAAELLAAMGLAANRAIRVCRTGEPVIVQVGGTRLGLAASVAESVLVRPG
jgi:Fe2+ transport system protein FeoA